MTGTSTRTPTTVASATGEDVPKRETATATDNSKKLDAPIIAAGAMISLVSASRRQIAHDYGADYTFSPDEPDLASKIRELTRDSGRGETIKNIPQGGCNGVIEVTGNPAALDAALDYTAPFGRIALVGCSRTPTERLDFYNKVHRPGISLLGGHNFARPRTDSQAGFWTMRRDMSFLLRLIQQKRFDPSRMLNVVAPPEQAPELYARLLAHDQNLLGVVFDWSR